MRFSHGGQSQKWNNLYNSGNESLFLVIYGATLMIIELFDRVSSPCLGQLTGGAWNSRLLSALLHSSLAYRFSTSFIKKTSVRCCVDYIAGLIRRKLSVPVLMVMTVGYSGMCSAEGFLPDNREILMMPQLCQWWYGPRVGMEPALIPKGPPFDMSGCTRFHYFCDAHTDLVRAEKNANINQGKAKYQLNRAIGTLKGQVVFRKAEPACSKYLLADTSYSLGRALELYSRLEKFSSFSAQAIGPLLEAIELTPEDIRPYQVLGDIYVALKKPQQAEEVLYRGLQINPRSKPLLRRYKDVGGKRLPPALKTTEPNETSNLGDAQHLTTDHVSIQKEDSISGVGTDHEIPHDNQAVVGAELQREKTQAAQEKSTLSRNCRFCSDIDVSKDKTYPDPVQSKSSTQGSEKPSCRFCP